MSIDKHQQLRDRSKMFALRVIKMSDLLPRTRAANVITNQFIAKIGVVLEEADETVFWLEMLRDSEIVPAQKMRDLLGEANQLMLIFFASRKTAKA